VLNENQAPAETMELPIPFDHVRLVYKPAGSSKDVIVRAIETGEPRYHRANGAKTPDYTRYVAGSNEVIPWPEEEDPHGERQPDDTVRLLVDEQTYIPEVLNPPFPRGVADEIVARFSHNRMLHRDEWVKRKIVEDARSAWYESRTLLTPQQQQLAKLAKQRQEEERKLRLGYKTGKLAQSREKLFKQPSPAENASQNLSVQP
jgi:hypothetical protein